MPRSTLELAPGCCPKLSGDADLIPMRRVERRLSRLVHKGETMNSREEKLAMRFVDLLAEKALRGGQTVWRWNNMSPSWRGIFIEAVPAFLEELGYRIEEGRIDERSEDEQIRVRCE